MAQRSGVLYLHSYLRLEVDRGGEGLITPSCRWLACSCCRSSLLDATFESQRALALTTRTPLRISDPAKLRAMTRLGANPCKWLSGLNQNVRSDFVHRGCCVVSEYSPVMTAAIDTTTAIWASVVSCSDPGWKYQNRQVPASAEGAAAEYSGSGL